MSYSFTVIGTTHSILHLVHEYIVLILERAEKM
jgi:hypothetical protein